MLCCFEEATPSQKLILRRKLVGKASIFVQKYGILCETGLKKKKKKKIKNTKILYFWSLKRRKY